MSVPRGTRMIRSSFTALVLLVESVEDMGQFFRGDPSSRVFDFNGHSLLVRGQDEVYGAAAPRIMDGVFNQILQCPLNQPDIGLHKGEIFFHSGRETDSFILCLESEFLDQVLNEIPQIKWLGLRDDFIRPDAPAFSASNTRSLSSYTETMITSIAINAHEIPRQHYGFRSYFKPGECFATIYFFSKS